MPKPKQKNGHKKIKPTLHIFCEGEKTEPYYFKSYIQENHSDIRQLATIVVEKTDKNTPIALVDEAISHKKQSGLAIDKYWVVYDREAVDKYPHDLHKQARDKAKANNIEIAFSSVCFEIWLLLHLTDKCSSYTNCAELLKQSDLKKLLAKECGIQNYDKAIPTLFESLKGNVDNAKARAKNMCDRAKDSAEIGKSEPYYFNPYTDVHLLLNAMDQFKEDLKK